MPVKKLKDGTSYEKATHHTGAKLKGLWKITWKIDGVRAMRNADGKVVSRNGKPLYNLDHLEFKDAEIFRKDWETSVSLVRTQSPQAIYQDDVYELGYSTYDKRLDAPFDLLRDPTFAECEMWMEEALSRGYEGIVLRGESRGKPKWIKVVPKLNADVRITGYIMGQGKHEGKIGSWTTDHGNVGSGFTDAQRAEWTEAGLDSFIGKIIEVSYREKTSAGKLRFPAFERFRFDKDEESLT